MPLPILTEEQRREALAKAAKARKDRAELKQQLKAEKVSLRDLLSKQGDDVVGKMKVSSVLESLPGVGKVRARKIMERLDISFEQARARPRRQAEGRGAAHRVRREGKTSARLFVISGPSAVGKGTVVGSAAGERAAGTWSCPSPAPRGLRVPARWTA